MDSDDRELMGLAALAARLDMRWIAECGDYYEHRPHMLPGYWDKWNPLCDDGDALRLAVALEMDVMQRRSDHEVLVQTPMLATIREPIGADRQAATRRAIVRAAAAMAEGRVLALGSTDGSGPLPEEALRQQAFLILARLQSGTEDVVRLDAALAAVAAERERCALIVEDMVRAVDGADALAAIRGA